MRANTSEWHGPNTVVVFGDMLGFAQIVETSPDTTEEHLRRLRRDWTVIRSASRDAHSWPNQSTQFLSQRRGKRFLLERRFILFHEILDDYLATLPLGSRVTVIAFSDSFFIAADNGDAVLAFCAQLLVAMILNDIPVRMGVARGSFNLHMPKAVDGAFRRVHSMPFLGKGVVRAYKAESSGLKGLRIGLHPSLIQGMPELASPVAVELPPHESQHVCAHELNYLFPFFASADRARSLPLDVVARVKLMGDQVRRKPRELLHYRRTLCALSRMSRSGKSQDGWS